jgi:hypothetical protein
VALVALGLSLGTRSPVQADVLPPHSTVVGKTIGEWSAEWWKWAFSFSVPNDPFTDQTGANANLGQSGEVFFIAGTAGGNAERTFTVPAGKFLLIPLVNAELSQVDEPPGTTAAQVRQDVKAIADQIDSLHATIDGVAVPNLFSHRETSPDFSFIIAPNNAFGEPAGPSGIAVADGYWLMLTPLSANEQHTIQFGGGATAFGFSVDVRDHIRTVAPNPEPSTLVLWGVGTAGLLAYNWWRRKQAV